MGFLWVGPDSILRLHGGRLEMGTVDFAEVLGLYERRAAYLPAYLTVRVEAL